MFRRKYTDVRAVDGVSFSIASGEMVGFLGPNGAGKTTTLKCLPGLLYPTSGRATVLGYTPHERKTEFLRSFTLVMGPSAPWTASDDWAFVNKVVADPNDPNKLWVANNGGIKTYDEAANTFSAVPGIVASPCTALEVETQGAAEADRSAVYE